MTSTTPSSPPPVDYVLRVPTAVTDSNARIVVIGDALIDELVDERGTIRLPGGCGLNVALGLATLGHAVDLVATIGDDDDADLIAGALTGTSVTGIWARHPLGTAIARSTRVDGEPRYEFNAAARHRTLPFNPKQRAALAGAHLVAISGFPFDDTDEADRLRNVLLTAGVPVAIDANPRAGMLRDADRFVDNLERAVAVADLVKIGTEDAELLYDCPLEDVARDFKVLGAGMVLATAGADGASLLQADGLTAHCPISTMEAPVVDTMGAGDASFAAIISHLAQHGEPRGADGATALRRAMDIAAATCRSIGPALILPPDNKDVTA